MIRPKANVTNHLVNFYLILGVSASGSHSSCRLRIVDCFLGGFLHFCLDGCIFRTLLNLDCTGESIGGSIVLLLVRLKALDFILLNTGGKSQDGCLNTRVGCLEILLKLALFLGWSFQSGFTAFGAYLERPRLRVGFRPSDDSLYNTGPVFVAGVVSVYLEDNKM